MIVGESELPMKHFKFTELFWRSFIFIIQFSLLRFLDLLGLGNTSIFLKYFNIQLVFVQKLVSKYLTKIGGPDMRDSVL